MTSGRASTTCSIRSALCCPVECQLTTRRRQPPGDERGRLRLVASIRVCICHMARATAGEVYRLETYFRREWLGRRVTFSESMMLDVVEWAEKCAAAGVPWGRGSELARDIETLRHSRHATHFRQRQCGADCPQCWREQAGIPVGLVKRVWKLLRHECASGWGRSASDRGAC